MRLSIRDLQWLMVVVAMALAWWSDNQPKNAAIQQAQRQRILLRDSKAVCDYFDNFLKQNGYVHRCEWMPFVRDWSVLDEPLR